MIVCIFEDRPVALTGAKLLIASVRRHCPGVRVVVHCPLPSPSFHEWANACSEIVVRSDPSLLGQGWNSKPTVLLQALDEGAEEAVWLDTDIILAGDFRALLLKCARDTLVVGQEHFWGYYQGGTIRTRMWTLPVGRSIPYTVNTGVVRVTPAHRPLLLAWKSLLRDERYIAAQRIHPMQARPIHLQGDQDVLTALLGSETFRDIDISYLRRGLEVLQSVGAEGYTIGERLRNAGGPLPPLIHGIAPKPWASSDDGGFRAYLDLTLRELSPYTFVARDYVEELNMSLSGVNIQTRLGRILQALAGGEPSLQALPLCALITAAKLLKRIAGFGPPTVWGRNRWPSWWHRFRAVAASRGR